MLRPNYEKRRDPTDSTLAWGPAALILAALPQSFAAEPGWRGTSRRVVIPLLEWLDRKGTARRLPDDRRVMRGPPGPAPNGGR
jgi:hypothetical protein